jgi:hypothetical protein
MPILKSLFSNEGAFFVPQNLKTKQWESNPDTSGDAPPRRINDFKERLLVMKGLFLCTHPDA